MEVDVEASGERGRGLARAATLLLVATLASTGCATTASADKGYADRAKKLQSRLEDVERTNGRLTVRVEELEDQLFLLNDRVESTRIAMQRRSTARRPTYVARGPQAPQPAPETYYAPGDYERRYVRPRKTVVRKPSKRFKLHHEERNAAIVRETRQGAQAAPAPTNVGKEVVIDEAKYRKMFPGDRTVGGSSSAPKRGAQPRVTEEKLRPGKVAAAPVKRSPTPQVRSKVVTRRARKSGLAGYRESLAAYRSGRYQDALSGFESFLGAKPKDDYVDNALYWIGECHYGLGDYSAAVKYFERVMREKPDGNKVPDAMLKMSLALDRVGKAERATGVLQKLTQRYPLTNAGRLGMQKLKNR